MLLFCLSCYIRRYMKHEMLEVPLINMKRVEVLLERFFFGMRWWMAIVYFALTTALLAIAAKSIQMGAMILWSCLSMGFDDIILQSLDLVDLAMVGNLVLIVMFSGYENFVSRLDITDHDDYPKWIGHVTFSDLKMKLMASIVAMSSIHLLTVFIMLDKVSEKEIFWSVVMTLTFVVSAVLLAWTDRIKEKRSGVQDGSH